MSSFLHSFHKYLLHTYWVLDTVLGFYVIWTIMRVLYFDLFASTLTVTLKEPCLYIVVVFHSVLSDSLRPSALQHTRLPCPSPSPRICSNLCPLSRWCHPAISSSVIPFSSCSQIFLSIMVFSNESTHCIRLLDGNRSAHLPGVVCSPHFDSFDSYNFLGGRYYCHLLPLLLLLPFVQGE